jgi:hypothetical protein
MIVSDAMDDALVCASRLTGDEAAGVVGHNRFFARQSACPWGAASRRAMIDESAALPATANYR